MKKLQSFSRLWIHADALLTRRKHWEETQLCLRARCVHYETRHGGRGYPRGDRRSDSLTSERLNGRRVRVRSSRKGEWQRWGWIRGWGVCGRKTAGKSSAGCITLRWWDMQVVGRGSPSAAACWDSPGLWCAYPEEKKAMIQRKVWLSQTETSERETAAAGTDRVS